MPFSYEGCSNIGLAARFEILELENYRQTCITTLAHKRLSHPQGFEPGPPAKRIIQSWRAPQYTGAAYWNNMRFVMCFYQ